MIPNKRVLFTSALVLAASLTCLSAINIGGWPVSDAQAGEMTDGFYLSPTESSFEDAVSDLEDAVINQGLVIDYKGMVGDMLARTGEAADSKTPYSNAIYLQFCSAALTHSAVAADSRNIAVCPYVVFAYETAEGGEVSVGYRRPIGVKSAESDAAMAVIDKLLQEIVDEAAE